MGNKKIRILFVCTRNSCRSQMAEGWAKHVYPNIFDAKSAGIKKHQLDPLAIEVMLEKNVDISRQQSKLIDEVDTKSLDYVITLCDEANQHCPVMPGKIKTLHKHIEDPQKFALEIKNKNNILFHYRRIRDEIRNLVMSLSKELTL